jgi:hypothetical protein
MTIETGEFSMKPTPKLSSAQRSFLKRLYLDGGYSRLHNATYQTAMALHDKGMVVVSIDTPVKGHVTITEDGTRVAQAIIDLLTSTTGRLMDVTIENDRMSLSWKKGA